LRRQSLTRRSRRARSGIISSSPCSSSSPAGAPWAAAVTCHGTTIVALNVKNKSTYRFIPLFLPVLSLSNPYRSSTLFLQVYFINAYKVFDKNPAWKINPCLIFSLLFTQYFFLKFIPNQP
jgi:hypothetical protein